jgi:hypothetical protein
MKPKRDWIDYAGLASSIAQNIQLEGISNSMAELQKSEARKQADEERLAIFRENILKLEDQLDAVLNAKPSLLCRVFFIKVIAIKKMLEHLGHAHIRSISYDDKDRWRALCLRVESARSDAEDRLQPSVAADLEKAIDYSMKLPIMEANIEYSKEVEAYQAAKANLDELTRRTASFKTARKVLAWTAAAATFISADIWIFSLDNGIFAIGPAILAFCTVYAVSLLHPIASLCSQREKAYWEVFRMDEHEPSSSGKSVAEQIKEYHDCIAFINGISEDEPIRSKFMN